MTIIEARDIMGKQFIGPDELKSMPCAFGALVPPAIPFTQEILREYAGAYVLVFTPRSYADGSLITLNSLRQIFGTDPHISEPCLYNQDWYVHEDFASREVLDGKWHLIRKEVLEEMRAQTPEYVEHALLASESLPTAITCTFAFFAYWFHTGGDCLWNHDFVWCSDKDHNGDRIYVGRYEDPTGVNKKGFNIHRHLRLREMYSAAPEVR